MTKHVKKHFLLSILIFSLLLISCLYSIMAPSAYATEETLQEKGLVISNDVVGLDLTKYATTAKEFPQDSYLGVLPQESIRYNLQSNESKLDMLYTFISGNLQKIHVLEVDGTPRMTKATADPIERAKDFLGNYSSHTVDLFYGELRSTLDTIDINKNLTAISGNTKLEVTTSSDSATFQWTYTFNGVEAPDKCVALRYKNGVLKYFIDNWDLYKIGNTNINLSKQEAIDIAMARSKTLTWGKTETESNGTIELKYNVTNAMVWETIFAPSLYMDKARSENLLELYPMRHIWVSLDKFYPGNVYGINVYVWADTGEIGFIKERFSTMDPTPDLVATYDDIVAVALDDGSTGEAQSNLLSFSWIALPIVIVSMLVAVPVYLSKKKKGTVSFNLPKLRSFKISGVLLCLLLISSTVMVVMSASTANADPLYGRATIWGSESVGAWNETIWSGGVQGSSWRKTNPEVWQQQETAQFIANKFANNGYSASNYQGDNGLGSYKDTILAEIESNEANYPRVAIVDFDHGNGQTEIDDIPPDELHYMFEDNHGTYSGGCNETKGEVHHEHLVYDMEIYQKTTGKTFFAFINTCNSAHVDDFFGDWPSTQGIIPGTTRARGMPYAWTHQNVTETPMTNPPPGWMSCDAYSYSDNGDFCYIGFWMGSAALSQEIETHPYHLWVEHFFAYALIDNISIKNALDDASQGIFLEDFDQTPLYDEEGFIASWPMYLNGSWQEVYPEEMRRGWLKVYGNAHIKLYQPALTLSATGGLSPTFYIDGQPYNTGTHRLITDVYTIDVSDVPGYVFSHFSYGGSTYGSRPANIQIASDGELTAHYNPIQQYYDISTGSVYIDDGEYHQFEVPFYIDGQEVGPTWNTYQVSEGYHTFAVPQVAYAWPNGAIVFQYWVVNGWPGPSSNPIGGTIQSDLFLGAVYEVIYLP
jgi:hypothetical protein